jgi:predicted MFS family arabinose efflux permease
VFAELRQRIPDRNIWVVYATIFVLSIAYGLAIALTPIVLAHREMLDSEIGLLASSFGLGLVAFAVPAGMLIRKLSARTMLAVCILGYALMIGIFPFLPEYWEMALCRFLDGAFSVGAWVSCETLLLLRASEANKAFVTSRYAQATLVGYVVGPIIAFALQDAVSAEETFVLAAIIAAGSAIIARGQLDPDPPEARGEDALELGGAPKRSTTQLAWLIKMSALATFMTGFFQSAAVLFLAGYLTAEKAVPEGDTRLVVAFAAGGALLMSGRAGKIADGVGHLLVMRVLAIAGVIAMVVMIPTTSFAVIALLLFFGGGALLTVPPIALALQGVIARPVEYTRTNSIFNVFFSSGLLLGPLATGYLRDAGGDGILYLFAGLWISFVILSWLFRADDPRVARRQATAVIPLAERGT